MYKNARARPSGGFRQTGIAGAIDDGPRKTVVPKTPENEAFGERVEIATSPAPSVWRLIVWDVAPAQAGLMARLKMIPAKKKPTTFWREYPNRKQVEGAVSLLASAGLHGVAKRAEKHPDKAKFKKTHLVTSREGFGGNLNARPIPGAWRRKKRHP